MGAGVALTAASFPSRSCPHPRFSGWEERGVSHPLPQPLPLAGPGPAETMGGPGSLERPQRPGGHDESPEHGTLRKVRGSGIIPPGGAEGPGAGALANGEPDADQLFPVSLEAQQAQKDFYSRRELGGTGGGTGWGGKSRGAGC